MPKEVELPEINISVIYFFKQVLINLILYIYIVLRSNKRSGNSTP